MRVILFILLLLPFVNAYALDFSLYEGAIGLSVKKGEKSYICSAVAINRWVLVTAAHCLDKCSKVKAYSGFDIKNPEEFFEVSRFKIHPSYNREKSYIDFDVAKILLTRPLPVDTPIYQIAEVKSHFELNRVGFGGREKENKRTVVTGLRDFIFDQETISMQDNFSHSGDSGGPIFQNIYGKLYLVAVHSTLEKKEISRNPLLWPLRPWLLSKF